MKLTSEEAYSYLMHAKSVIDGGYIEHSIRVGEAACRIIEQLGLDGDKAKALGYIHDIGKLYDTPFSQHPAKGYEYLLSLGVDPEYANICLTHSYLNNDLNCTAGGFIDPNSYQYEFRKEFIKNHQYTIYEKVICLCDLMCTNKFLTMEERLIELMMRRGAHANTQYHLEKAMELKAEIEEKLGVTIYSLFPEITDRLNNKEDKGNKVY